MNYVKLFSLNQVSKNTSKLYRQELVRFFNFVKTDLPNVSIAHILKYRNSFADLHPITVAWKISVIRSFFTFLVQEQILPHNPALNVKSPRVKRHPHFPGFNHFDFQQLLKIVSQSGFRTSRDFCLLKCMGRLGMRVSEVCQLRLENYDANADFPVFLIKSKGNTFRSIPLLDRISEEISRHLDLYSFTPEPDSPLFPASTKTSRPLGSRAVQYIVKRRSQAAGLSSQITPHILRHYALSTLLKEGHDLFTIQTFAGHSQLATTARYLHNLKQQEKYTMDIYRKNSLMRTFL